MKLIRPDTRYPVNSMFSISGDSTEMWISGYNVRVSTIAKVLVQPRRTDKKVLVCLSDIDHDQNVNVLINKKFLIEQIA